MKKLTHMQLFRFWFVYLITAPLAFLLGPLFDIGEFEGWLALLICSGLSILLVSGVVWAAKLVPDEDWTVWGARVMGRGMHSVFLFFTGAACITMMTFNLASYIDLFGSVYLPGTPNGLIGGFFLLCACLAARNGLRTIVYLTDGFFLTAILAAFFIFPFLTGQLNYRMTIALLTHWDLTQLSKSVLFVFTWFGEIAFCFTILPQFKQDKTLKFLAFANVGACLLIMLYWFATLLLFGPHFGSHLRFPLMETIRFIVVSQLVENLDPVLLSIWTSSLLVKSALLLYISAKIAAQLFRLDSEKPYVFMTGTLVLVYAIRLVEKPGELNQFMYSVAFNVFLFLVECFPLLYGIVGTLRKSKLQAKEPAQEPASPGASASPST